MFEVGMGKARTVYWPHSPQGERCHVKDVCAGDSEGVGHGSRDVPFFLRRLCDLNPAAKRIVMPYLRWRMKRMHSVDIQIMLESGQIVIEDLDFFAAELA